MRKIRTIKFFLLSVLFIVVTATSALAEAWKFGVLADTQWKSNVDGKNPNTVAVGIIDQLNKEFIKKGVKFVVQVGDLTDDGSLAGMDTRVAAAQALYEAGIGFYPLRGNHEGSLAATLRFQMLYPQTQDSGSYVFGATNFNSPKENLKGLSYSFDYKNARFILLDQFTRTDNTNYLGSSNNNIIDQVAWIDNELSTRPAATHAFVFGHKELIGQNHADGLFGSNPSGNLPVQNAFISSLAVNGVHYVIGGHDHIHHRSMVASPDATATIQQIICASDSYKFYVPQVPSNDSKYSIPAYGVTTGERERVISQELFTIGYYIFTVDGPRVTVDYYAAPNGCNGDCDLVNTPTLSFTKRETFGYSLNGKEFLIPEGASYTAIRDSFSTTNAEILSGTNNSTAAAYDGRPLTKAVDTGWTAGVVSTPKSASDTASNILSLWGMTGSLGSEQTDEYTLSMSYEQEKARTEHLGEGLFGLATRDSAGNWINAVDKNFGGVKKFVMGAWKAGYALGTYGVDPSTKTAWAVINYTGDFAAARFSNAWAVK